jgi:hypothetical protein
MNADRIGRNSKTSRSLATENELPGWICPKADARRAVCAADWGWLFSHGFPHVKSYLFAVLAASMLM